MEVRAGIEVGELEPRQSTTLLVFASLFRVHLDFGCLYLYFSSFYLLKIQDPISSLFSRTYLGLCSKNLA